MNKSAISKLACYKCGCRMNEMLEDKDGSRILLGCLMCGSIRTVIIAKQNKSKANETQSN